MSSALASVAAYSRGLFEPHASTPAFITSILSDTSTMLNSEVSATNFAVAAKAFASPLESFTATSSGLKFNPTLSYCKAFHTVSLVTRSAFFIPESNMAASTVGLKNVFSCLYSTVSPPVVTFLTPFPITTGRIGGADASASSALASSDT